MAEKQTETGDPAAKAALDAQMRLKTQAEEALAALAEVIESTSAFADQVEGTRSCSKYDRLREELRERLATAAATAVQINLLADIRDAVVFLAQAINALMAQAENARVISMLKGGKR